MASENSFSDPLNDLLLAEVDDNGEFVEDQGGSTPDPDALLDGVEESEEDPILDSDDDDVVEEPSDDLDEALLADEDVVGDEPEANTGRGGKRIQALLADREELRGELGQMQQAVQSLESRAGQAVSQLEAELSKERQARLELEQSMSRRPATDEDLSDTEKFKRSIVEEVMGGLDSKIKPIQEHLSQRERQEQEYKQAVRRKDTLGRLSAATDMAMGDVLSDLSPEAQKELAEEGGAWLLNGAAAHRRMPEAQAPHLKRWLDTYFEQRLNGLRAKRKEATAKNASVPAAPRAAAVGAKGEATPKVSADEVYNAGYDSYWDASRDDFKQVYAQRRAKATG